MLLPVSVTGEFLKLAHKFDFQRNAPNIGPAHSFWRPSWNAVDLDLARGPRTTRNGANARPNYESARHPPFPSTICQKCVLAFDHHCVWLNNCVGASNYRAFLTLLAGAAAMLCTQVGYGVWVFAAYGADMPLFDTEVRTRAYAALSGDVFFGLTVAVTVLAVVGLALVLQLGAFHVYLVAHGQTTYEFVVARVRSAAVAAAPTPAAAPVGDALAVTAAAAAVEGVSTRHERSQSVPEITLTAESALSEVGEFDEGAKKEVEEGTP